MKEIAETETNRILNLLNYSHERLSIICKGQLSSALKKEAREREDKIFNNEVNDRFNRLF
jgi:hypothetical protein